MNDMVLAGEDVLQEFMLGTAEWTWLIVAVPTGANTWSKRARALTIAREPGGHERVTSRP